MAEHEEVRALVHELNNLLGAALNFSQLVGKEVTQAAAGDHDRPWAVVSEDVAQIELAITRSAEVAQRLSAATKEPPAA